MDVMLIKYVCYVYYYYVVVYLMCCSVVNK